MHATPSSVNRVSEFGDPSILETGEFCSLSESTRWPTLGAPATLVTFNSSEQSQLGCGSSQSSKAGAGVSPSQVRRPVAPSFAMGLGLQLHSQVHTAKLLGDLHASSKFPDKPARGFKPRVQLGLQDHANSGGESACGVRERSTRRALLKKGVRSSGNSLLCGRNGGRIAGSLGEFESSWGKDPVLVAGASTGGLFWQPFWNAGANSGASSSSLGFSGGGGDTGAGGDGEGGGGGGNGNGGDDGGGFDPSGGEIRVNALVGSDDEEQAARVPEFRAPGLASLSSAAGDALDGEAPFGDLLLGRQKRAAAAEETAAKVPSHKGTPGGILRKIDKAAHNFLSPTNNGNHRERSGSQGGSSGASSRKETERDVLIEEDEALAKRSETAALRRLQREAFSDLLRVRERLDKLEIYTGLRPSKTQSSLGGGGAKTKLQGEVSAGGAFVLLDDQSSRQSRAALEQAGLHTGLDVRFTFETPYRDRDVMITECSAGHSGSDGSILGGPISVTKLVYNAQVTDDFNVVVAPLGARGSDVTETVNPLQGQALTQFARVGPAMYQHCVGSALGATLRGRTSLLSLSQFLSGWGCGSSLSDSPVNSGPLCLSTLAHVLFQPWENSVFSISAVNRFWPSPPLPSFRGLHWSEMGPLVLSKSHCSHKSGSSSPQVSSPRDLGRTSMDNTSMRDSRTSMDNTSMRDFRTSMENLSLRDFRTSSDNNPSGYSASAAWGTPYGEAERGIITIPETHGSAQQSIAVAGEIDVGANMSLAGWAQADREYWLQEGDNKEIEWGVSLSKAVGTTAGWGLCVGSSKVDLWSTARDAANRFPGTGDGLGDPCDMQLQMEAFLKLSMGRGFTLQPGLVYLLNKQSQTPAFVLRSSWAL